MCDTNNNMQIVLVPVDKITPYWRNPRRNDKTVDALANIAIRNHGFDVPIVLDQNNVIVKGHARLKAAKKLGMKEVPCVYSTADPEAIKADRIADNTIQEMSLWDMSKREIELEKINNPELNRLFSPDDFSHVDASKFSEPLQVPNFHGTSLDDYAEDMGGVESASQSYYGGFGSNDENVAPNDNPERAFVTDNGDFTAVRREAQGELSAGQRESFIPQTKEPQTAKKALKTLCPYCGKTVYIRL